MYMTDEKKRQKEEQTATFVFHPLSLSLRDHLFQRQPPGPIRSYQSCSEIEIAPLFAGSENEGGRRKTDVSARSFSCRCLREFNRELCRNDSQCASGRKLKVATELRLKRKGNTCPTPRYSPLFIPFFETWACENARLKNFL